MKLKIRYKRLTTFEAEVDVPSGPRDEMLENGIYAADAQDLWMEVAEETVSQEIVSEEGKVAMVR